MTGSISTLSESPFSGGKRHHEVEIKELRRRIMELRKKYYRLGEVEAITGIPRRTISRWVSKGYVIVEQGRMKGMREVRRFTGANIELLQWIREKVRAGWKHINALFNWTTKRPLKSLKELGTYRRHFKDGGSPVVRLLGWVHRCLTGELQEVAETRAEVEAIKVEIDERERWWENKFEVDTEIDRILKEIDSRPQKSANEITKDEELPVGFYGGMEMSDYLYESGREDLYERAEIMTEAAWI